MTEDDEDAPTPTRRLTGQYPITDGERAAHYVAYPPGAPVVADPGPTVHERVKSLEDSRKFWRWIAGLVLPLLFAGSLSIVLYSVDKITASSERVGATLARLDAVIKTVDGLQGADIGAVQARIEALNRMLDVLQQDIRDLRRELHKLSGVTPDLGMSIARRDAVPQASCGAGCTVSQDCSNIFSQCRYCYLGHCSSTLPAQPTSDAGVDAPIATPKGLTDDLVSNP